MVPGAARSLTPIIIIHMVNNVALIGESYWVE
jgi:hypothetical protein